MFVKVKQVAAVGTAAVGTAVAGLGWVAIMSPVVAHAQPPRIPQGNSVTCPDIAGINYMPDPDNTNAYYLCVDGLPQHHYQCPPVTRLVMTTPPKCIPFPHPMP
jgi:hypothetical protein